MTTYVPDSHRASDEISEKSGGFSDEQKPAPLGASIETRPTGLWANWRQPAVDLDSIATQPSVFDDPVTLEAYRPPPQVGLVMCA